MTNPNLYTASFHADVKAFHMKTKHYLCVYEEKKALVDFILHCSQYTLKFALAFSVSISYRVRQMAHAILVLTTE